MLVMLMLVLVVLLVLPALMAMVLVVMVSGLRLKPSAWLEQQARLRQHGSANRRGLGVRLLIVASRNVHHFVHTNYKGWEEVNIFLVSTKTRNVHLGKSGGEQFRTYKCIQM